MNADVQEDIQVDVDQEVAVKPPSMYKVVLHNDNVTTFDFVMMVLHNIFHMDLDEAEYLTVMIHTHGSGVAGVYTKEVAQEKTNASTTLALNFGFPLSVTAEEE